MRCRRASSPCIATGWRSPPPHFDGSVLPFSADDDDESAATVGDWLLLDSVTPHAAATAGAKKPVQAKSRRARAADPAHRRERRYALHRHLLQRRVQRRAARALSRACRAGRRDAGRRADQGRSGRRCGRLFVEGRAADAGTRGRTSRRPRCRRRARCCVPGAARARRSRSSARRASASRRW